MSGSPEMTDHLRIKTLEKEKELLAQAFVRTWFCSSMSNLDEVENILKEMGLSLDEECLHQLDDMEEGEPSDGKIYEELSKDEDEEPHFSLALVERLISEDQEEAP